MDNNKSESEIFDRIFENPGRNIKKLARVLFVLGLVVAVVAFFLGSLMLISASNKDIGYYSPKPLGMDRMLSCSYEEAQEYDVVHGYVGKIMMVDSLWLALGCLSFLPLYGFGCLVEDTHEIKKAIAGEHTD